MTPRSVGTVRATTEPLQVIEPGVVDYRQAWAMQQSLADQRAADSGPDSLILLEHPSVYTAGKRTEPADLPTDGSEVVEVDRGGRITWHGPGQLVGYPIVKMADPVEIHDYVRLLEQVLIDACAAVGVAAGRVDGRSGVWLPAAGLKPARKIAAIGIRVSRGVTQHGFALNCDCALGAFNRIVPCGIADAGVTSLAIELGRPVTVAEMQPIVRTLLLDALSSTAPTSRQGALA